MNPSVPQLANTAAELAHAVVTHRQAEAEKLAGKVLLLAEPFRNLTLDPSPAEGQRDTSRKAVLTARRALRGWARTVHYLLQRDELGGGNGMTNSEIIAAFPKVNPRTLQPRTAELFKAGFILDSGLRRRNPRNHEEIVWRLSDAGRAHQIEKADDE